MGPGVDFRADRGVFTFSLADSARAPAEDKSVDLLHANLDGLGGRLLETAIERRIDAHATGSQIAFFVAREEPVTHEVDIVGSIVRFHVRLRELERRGFGGRHLGFRDDMVIEHRL